MFEVKTFSKNLPNAKNYVSKLQYFSCVYLYLLKLNKQNRYVIFLSL